MHFHRQRRPVFRDGCLLRLLSKPAGNGALPAHGGARRLCRQRRLRALMERFGSEDLNVISFFFRVLGVVWRGQLYPYPPCTSLCLYAYLYVFLIRY
jgi:hypothetical protein